MHERFSGLGRRQQTHDRHPSSQSERPMLEGLGERGLAQRLGDSTTLDVGGRTQENESVPSGGRETSDAFDDRLTMLRQRGAEEEDPDEMNGDGVLPGTPGQPDAGKRSPQDACNGERQCVERRVPRPPSDHRQHQEREHDRDPHLVYQRPERKAVFARPEASEHPDVIRDGTSSRRLVPVRLEPIAHPRDVAASQESCSSKCEQRGSEVRDVDPEDTLDQVTAVGPVDAR